MRHVDEGVIHAWLDGQVSDRAEAAWIEQHCQTCDDCRARLDEARATLQQAEALLASIAPAAEASRPAYEALVARGGRETAGNAPAASPAAPARFRTWQLAAGWAASVALAAALGWMVREDWRGDEQVPQLASREVTPQEAPTVAPPAAPVVSTPSPEATATASGGPPTPLADGLAQPRAAAPASAAASRVTDRATIGQAQRRLAAPQEAASAGPATDTLARRAEAAAEPFVATAESAVRDALPTTAAQGAADGDTVQFRALPPVQHFPPEAGRVAPRPVATPPPAAVALPSPAAGGGPAGAGGGGGRGDTGFGTGAGTGTGTGTGVPFVADADSARTLVVEPTVPAVSSLGAVAPATTSGRVMVDGMLVNAGTDVAAAQATTWRQMPRTEAAARTGMALYGLAGLTSSMTMLSADGTIVRTIYKTGLGEAVELWQQRMPSPDSGGRAGLGGQTLNRSADTFTGSWTATYGDVQVTLRGGAGVASWGERLRVE